MFRIVDELAVLAEDVAVTATASTTGVNIVGLNVGTNQHVVLLNTSATTGTVDGSNYYTVAIEASDTIGGTYVEIGESVVLPATAGKYQIAFTSEELNRLVPNADYFRVTTTKTGTTATAVMVTAFISKI
jgi:hypothetical protein